MNYCYYYHIKISDLWFPKTTFFDQIRSKIFRSNSDKPEIIGKIRVGTSMSSARRPDFLTDFLWGPEERWEVAIGSLLLLLFHVLSQKFTTNSELAQRRHSHDKSCWPKQLFLLFCRHHTHNNLKFEIKSNCLKG